MGVHDIDKYPAVKALLGIPEDEPIFILRAQDILYAPTLSAYEALYLAACVNTSMADNQWNFADGIDEAAENGRHWQRENEERVKIPD